MTHNANKFLFNASLDKIYLLTDTRHSNLRYLNLKVVQSRALVQSTRVSVLGGCSPFLCSCITTSMC